MLRINVTEFFRANPLYKKLYHKGDPTKSYRAQTQSYILECKKCKENIKLSGNSLLMTMCRRCRRSIKILEDGSKELVEPESEEDIARAETGMARERNVVAVPEVAGPVLYPSSGEESEDEESEDDEPVMTLRSKDRGKDQGKKKPAVPNTDDMIDFLKETAKKTGGERRADEKAKRTAEEMADIDETILPKAKKEKKRPPPPPKANPVTTTAAAAAACPEIKERTIKIIELKLGQHFFSNELNTMFVAIE